MSISQTGGFRNWTGDPSKVQDQATFHGVEIADVLCVGCLRLYEQVTA